MVRFRVFGIAAIVIATLLSVMLHFSVLCCFLTMIHVANTRLRRGGGDQQCEHQYQEFHVSILNGYGF